MSKNSENHQARDYAKREADAQLLLEDFELSKDAEFFAHPAHRVEFLESLDATDFFSLCQHINARMRNTDPRERKNMSDRGSYLPGLGTPPADEKREAFNAGFDAISSYLKNSLDDDAQKVRGAAMATEALIIWVHPFNDGNGRTSRFIGKFIEDGTTDVDKLVKETSNGNERLRMYGENLRVDTYNTVKGLDMMWDDGELEEIERTTSMPVSEGIAKSIEKLLENKQAQDNIAKRAHDLRAWRESRLASKNVA